jgi:pimeloyl-ACP methyl ester carboxylesterase
VLVHGAFSDSSIWHSVIAELNRRGLRAIAAANPLRSVCGDARAISSVVRSIASPVVLVGHCYGGTVITEAANGNANVKSLVYVAGLAPDAGESSIALLHRFPGSTLSSNLVPVELSNGSHDLYIRSDKYHAQFAADVPAAEASLLAAIQRPVTKSALLQKPNVASWKRLPSYMIYGSADRNIPALALQCMAERAHARKTVVIDGASHALMISQPERVASFIEDAALA